MSRQSEHIDEHILAAFLSGDLPAPLRREIAAYIARSEHTRDLLLMATEAMEEVESGDGSVRRRSRQKGVRNRRPVEQDPEVAERDTRFWKVATLFAVSVLVLALAVVLLTIDYRNTTQNAQGETLGWAPSVSSDALEIRWPGQQDAVSYTVMAQNQDSGVNSMLTRTESTSFEITDEEFDFSARTPYRVWVLAMDAEDRVISRSASLLYIEPN